MHIFLSYGIVNKGNYDTGIDKKMPKTQTVQIDQDWEESHRTSQSSGLDNRNKMKGCPENIEYM